MILAPTSVNDAILGIPRPLASTCVSSEAYEAPLWVLLLDVLHLVLMLIFSGVFF